MCKVSLEELLVQSNNTVYPEYIGKYLYYFTAENVLDGLCVTSGSSGGNCGGCGNSGPLPGGIDQGEQEGPDINPSA